MMHKEQMTACFFEIGTMSKYGEEMYHVIDSETTLISSKRTQDRHLEAERPNSMQGLVV